MKTTPYKTIYPNLDYEMRLQEISQAQLSRILGVSRQQVMQKMNGSKSFTTLQRRVIAKKLHKGIKHLFEVQHDATRED